MILGFLLDDEPLCNYREGGGSNYRHWRLRPYSTMTVSTPSNFHVPGAARRWWITPCCEPLESRRRWLL